MRKIRSGELPAMKTGKHINSSWIVKKADFDSFLATLDGGHKSEDEEGSEIKEKFSRV